MQNLTIDPTALGNALIGQLKSAGIAVNTPQQAEAKAEKQYFEPKAAPAPVNPTPTVDTQRIEELVLGLERELTRILPSLIAQAGGAQGQRAVAIIVG